MNFGEGVPPTGKLELMALVYGAQVSGPVEGILLPRAIGFPTGIGEVTCHLAPVGTPWPTHYSQAGI